MPLTGIQLRIETSGAVHKSDVQMRNARKWFQRLQQESVVFTGTL
jgi:hypothetical protein